MSETKIVPFLFEGEAMVRVIDREGAPWFIATDVCGALGLGNPTETVRKLDEDEKGISTTETLGGPQEVVVVSESGLYALIFKSRKPQAARFRKWVTSEVLPAIRRTGSYHVEPAAQVIPPAGITPRPFDEWSLEEKRTNLAMVNGARHVFNKGAAAWMWERVGLPIPPSHLLPAWWQHEMTLRQRREGNAVTVMVNLPNGAH